MNIIERFLERIPRLAYIDENLERKSVTKYYLDEPIRRDSENEGRIFINFSQTTVTQYAIMAGVSPEINPIVFECFQDGENNQVIVRGCFSVYAERSEWLKAIFDQAWKDLLSNFP